jgi:hypothetical protein
MINSTGVVVRNCAKGSKGPRLDYIVVSAVAFNRLACGKRYRKIEVFAASLADINKALAVKVKIDPRTKLPKHF